MTEVVTIFLFAALWFYVVSGGADFGVGIVEIFSKDRNAVRKVGERAIAPIWEANHVWLIIVIVVLFVAFPEVHETITTFLHIPLVLMLAGIVMRGCAFTFRYYDIERDAKFQAFWSNIFRISSCLVPVVFGQIIGSFASTDFGTAESFAGLYISPWLNTFAVAVGIFTAVLFAWLASVFLATAEPIAFERWKRTTNRWSIALVVSGGVVSVAGLFADGVPIEKTITWACVTVATVGLVAISRRKPNWHFLVVRGLASIVALAILVGYFGGTYPTAFRALGVDIAWKPTAPDATIQALGIALLVGSTLILPGLGYLYRIFGKPEETAPEIS